MTIEEVMKKEVYRNADIQVIFGIGRSKASEMIRRIKSVSDRVGLQGRVHRLDYIDYLNNTKEIKNGY